MITHTWIFWIAASHNLLNKQNYLLITVQHHIIEHNSTYIFKQVYNIFNHLFCKSLLISLMKIFVSLQSSSIWIFPINICMVCLNNEVYWWKFLNCATFSFHLSSWIFLQVSQHLFKHIQVYYSLQNSWHTPHTSQKVQISFLGIAFNYWQCIYPQLLKTWTPWCSVHRQWNKQIIPTSRNNMSESLQTVQLSLDILKNVWHMQQISKQYTKLKHSICTSCNKELHQYSRLSSQHCHFPWLRLFLRRLL